MTPGTRLSFWVVNKGQSPDTSTRNKLLLHCEDAPDEEVGLCGTMQQEFVTGEGVEDIEGIEEEEDTCAYVGHLANEPEACVAMTGCFGQEDVEFSIASSHAADSGTYSWNMDGTVHVIDNPLREDRPSVPLRADGDEGDKEVINGDEIFMEKDHAVVARW